MDTLNIVSGNKEVTLEIDPVGSLTGEETHTVLGKTVDEKGAPVSGIVVRAYHQGVTLGSNILLGEETTNETGDYVIVYLTSLLPTGTLYANLTVHAFDGTTDELLAQSQASTKTESPRTITLSVSTKEFVGPSEYTQVKEAVDAILLTLEITTVDQVTLDGISFISEQTGFSQKVIADYLTGFLRNTQYPTVDTEVFYGFFRFDLPYKMAALLELPESVLREALESVTASNIINPDLADDIDAILAAIALLRQAGLLVDPLAIDGDSYMAQILIIAGIPESAEGVDGEHERFAGAFAVNGSDTDFWPNLGTSSVFTGSITEKGQKRDNVRLAFQIGVISQEHPPLVSVVFNGALTQVEEIGEITRQQWLDFINTSGVGLPNIEAADLTTENIEEYADALMTASEKAFPTEVLRTFMAADPANAGSDTLTFLQNNPDFDIKDSSPKQYFSDNSITDNAQKTSILELKRLWHLASGYDKLIQIDKFIEKGLLSASQIANIGRRNFVKNFSSDFGDKEAERIYKAAVKRTAAAAKLQVNFNPAVNNIGTQVFNDPSISETDVSSNPSLEAFFGSQDYCECAHCRSSFSPAAYLIDLLNFLKQIPVNGGPVGSTAWDVLQERRPEFINTALSCTNTNTTLPYIDLVNEVLENAVSTGNLNRQTTLSIESLRIRPEHQNKAAYDILANSATQYPWTLPFHLWNEETRAFLSLVNVHKSEIAFALAGTQENISSEIALIYLNISSSLQAILIDNSSFAPYYGGLSAAQLQSVSVLLDRSDITYDDLRELIETEFINPSNHEITFIDDSCKLEDASLAFTINEFKDLHRFERLRSLLNWNVETLDIALSAFGNSNIDNTVLIQLAGIQQISKRFKLPVTEIVCWYSVLSEKTYGNNPSFFDRVFLNPIHNPDETVRNTFSIGASITLLQGDQLDTSNAPVVSGVLQLKAPELLLLINTELPSGTTNKAGLAHLYRVASFVRTLNISVQDYLDLKQVTGLAPILPFISPPTVFEPNDTLKFLKRFDDLSKSPFSIADIQFLFLNQHLRVNKVDSEAMVNTISAIRSKLHGKLRERSISPNQTREDVMNLFLIFFNEEDAIKSLEIAENDTDPTDAVDFINEKWTPLVSDIARLRSNLALNGGSVTDANQRRKEVFLGFQSSILSELFLADEVIQAISDNFGFRTEVVAIVSKERLEAGNMFCNDDFVYSTTDVTALSDYGSLSDMLLRLVKLATSLDLLKVSSRHLDFVLGQTSTTGWYKLKKLPFTVPSGAITDFDTFLALSRAYHLEKMYQTPGDYSVIDQIQGAIADPQRLSEGTGWDIKDIEYLSGLNGFNFQSADYNNEDWFTKLHAVFTLIEKIGISAEQLNLLNNVDVTYEQSQALQATIKSNFTELSWKKIAIETRDGLRGKQRDALSDYLIGNSTTPKYQDTNDLYTHFLLDTEMAPCMLTSRIKLAISSVQLWIQRIQMDLEPNLKIGDEELDEWKWRKNYRVWEAARKVFLYPENWLEPELRDDKSPFFQDLEDELLQGEITSTSAENAYLNYLTKLDDTAVLEISGVYNEDDRGILHVFARTKNSPHIYYYRTQEDGFRWTAWQKLDLDIEGDHLIPVVFNRRPMIFWPVISESPVEIPDDDLIVTTSNGEITDDVPNKKPKTVADIKLAFSEWKNNKWQSKKLSKQKILSSKGFTPSNYFFKLLIADEGLRIDAFYHEGKNTAFNHIGAFKLNNCNADIEQDFLKTTPIPGNFSVTNSYFHNMKILENSGNTQFSITQSIRYRPVITQDVDLPSNIVRDEKIILNKTRGQFKITYPVTGIDLLSKVPFFFEDNGKIFFVQPLQEIFEKKILIDLPLKIIKMRRFKRSILPQDGLIPTRNTIPTEGSTGNAITNNNNTGGSTGGITLDNINDGFFRRTESQV